LQDGPSTAAKFSWPYGVAISPNGATLFVADSGNDCVRAVSLESGLVSTIAGGGTGSRGFQDGPSDSARFAWPYGVAVSPDGGKVYVADSGNNRVRAIDLRRGMVSTLAGAGNAGYQDGPAAHARFYGPRGVAASPDGAFVYVADYSNFRVRAIALDESREGTGEVSTLFGGGTDIYRPAGVAVTADGEVILAADTANVNVRGVRLGLRVTSPVEFGLDPNLPAHPGLGDWWSPTSKSEVEDLESIVSLGGNRTKFRVANRKADMGAGVNLGEESEDIEELHIRHAITAALLFVVMALLGAAGIVAGALWQRRNALLMLRHFQASSMSNRGPGSSLFPGDCVHMMYHTATVGLPSLEKSYLGAAGSGEVTLDMPLLLSEEDDFCDGSSNSSSTSGAGREGAGCERQSLGQSCLSGYGRSQHHSHTFQRHSLGSGGPAVPSTSQGPLTSFSTHQHVASVVRRTTSSIWPEALESRPIQHQRSVDKLTNFGPRFGR